jgi:hypothetical protein
MIEEKNKGVKGRNIKGKKEESYIEERSLMRYCPK